MKRAALMVSIAALIVGGFVLDANGQGRRLPQQQTLTFKVTDFRRAADVLSVELDGVSMNTPFAEIRGILEGRGYEELFQNSPKKLQFVKGAATRHSPGGVYHEIHVDERDGGRYLRFMRRRRDGPVSAGSKTLWSEQGLQPGADLVAIRSLKTTICDGIPDATEQWHLCPPDLDAEVRLKLGRAGVTLVEGLTIEAMHATPLATVIQIRRGP